MSTTAEIVEFDDVGEALREGRPLRQARSYRIQFAQGDLNFKTLNLTDPVPVGRQVLANAGLAPDAGYSLFAILPTGDFEDVRLDEPFDLRARGAERFIAFQTDRLFKLTLKDHQLEWGKPAISGAILYKLAGVAKGEGVFLEVRGAQNRLIEPEDLVDLTAPGVERFITAPRPPLTYEITVNGRPRVVNDEHVSYEQLVQLAFPGPQAPNVVYSVTYTHAASKPSSGTLGAGGVVEVKKKGTIFNVTPTIRS
jgi:hypothetical protein